jgi:hypothetical protein
MNFILLVFFTYPGLGKNAAHMGEIRNSYKIFGRKTSMEEATWA